MPETRRPPVLPAAALAAALALAGCMTPHSHVAPSQAVLDARAHRNVAAEQPCAAIPLSAVSPTMVGFAFEEGDLSELTRPILQRPAAWLACHPGVTAVIKPDADNHGTDAAQDALSRRRGEAVQTYLIAHGVGQGQVRLLTRGQAEPSGQYLLIRAEGRRW